MQNEISLPAALPVMTLPDTVLFPHALLPLHIFEPRYRRMLRDVLAADRIFVVAHLDARADAEAQFEPAYRVASAGIVRTCQKDADGTANLLLQGVCRVEFTGILREEPYRIVSVRPLASRAGAAAAENGRLREKLLSLLAVQREFGEPMPDALAAFLRTVADPAVFVDLAAFGLCTDAAMKQTLLETLDTHRRLELFADRVRADIEAIKLRRQLQGRLGDEAIGNN